jgi:cell division protein FtsL
MTNKQSLAQIALLVLVAGTVLILGLVQVSRRHQFIRVGYELSKATQQERTLREENRQLRLEISVLTNPSRVEHLARSLGLVPPAPNQIREVPAKGGTAP